MDNQGHHLKEQVWIGLTDTDRLIRYYGILSGKLRRKHTFLTWVTILSAAMAIIPLAIELSVLISIAFFGMVVISTLWSIHADYSSKATAANLFSEQYGYLATAWRQLWYGNVTSNDVTRLRQTYDKIPTGYEMAIDEGANEKAQKEAYKVIADEFRSDGDTRLATPTP